MDKIEECIIKLKSAGSKRILLQLPDGLKPKVFDIFNRFAKEFRVIVSSDAFYGACDVGNVESYANVDYIVQFGHSEIPNIKYPRPMMFIEYPYDTRIKIPYEQLSILSAKGYKTIGVLFSVQYRDQAIQLLDILKEKGFDAIMGKQDERLKYPGQVLGCNFSSAHSISLKADAFIVVSTGMFHAIGVQLATDKEVYIFDVNAMKLISIKEEVDLFLRKRYAKISRALDARKICVVVDTKIGQYREKLADKIIEQAKELGLETVKVEANDVKPTDMENMMCDAVVFTGCPRVPIDDAGKFKMPVLTPPEFQQLFGLKKTGKYVMDEIVSVDELHLNLSSDKVGGA